MDSRVYGFHTVKQTEIHTVQPVVSESSGSDVEMVVEKLRGRVK